MAADLVPDTLPRNLQGCEIRTVDCDLSRYFSAGTFDPAGAIRAQQEKLAELRAARKTLHEVPLGYYGLAHIPLQFLAGCSLSTHAKIHLFDLNRQSNRWNPLAEASSHSVVNVHTLAQPPDPSAVAIRISISYEVHIADVKAVLPGPIEDIRIGLPTPRIDAIMSCSQVDEVCARFRKTLDEIHGRVNKSKEVHVFYAGPAALGFSLGRQISKTVHHRVIVHNYASRDNPRYSWAVDVTSDYGPDALVFRQDQRGKT